MTVSIISILHVFMRSISTMTLWNIADPLTYDHRIVNKEIGGWIALVISNVRLGEKTWKRRDGTQMRARRVIK